MKATQSGIGNVKDKRAKDNEGNDGDAPFQEFEWEYVEQGFKSAIPVFAVLFIPIYFLSGFLGIPIMVTGLYGALKLLQLVIKRIGKKQYSSHEEYSKNKAIKTGFGWVMCFFSFSVVSLIAVEVSHALH